MADSDSSSESEGEARRRAEMASCVMNAAEVLASAPPSKRRPPAKRPATCSDDEGEEQATEGQQQVDRPFKRMTGERLHELLAKTFDARVADSVWERISLGSTVLPPIGQLLLFATSSTSQPTPWPPSSFSARPVAAPSDNADSLLSLVTLVQKQHVERAARDMARRPLHSARDVALQSDLKEQLAGLDVAQRAAVVHYFLSGGGRASAFAT